MTKVMIRATWHELPSVAEEWEPAIRTCAISAHEALRRHPWACNLTMSIPRVLPARLRYMEAVLGRLREAGFSADLTYRAYHALDSHILGYTLWEAGHSVDTEDLAGFAANFLRELPTDEYAYLAEHVDQHLRAPRPDEMGGFEFGLELIIDGLKRALGTA